jgi:hypothetical protein
MCHMQLQGCGEVGAYQHRSCPCHTLSLSWPLLSIRTEGKHVDGGVDKDMAVKVGVEGEDFSLVESGPGV